MSIAIYILKYNFKKKFFLPTLTMFLLFRIKDQFTKSRRLTVAMLWLILTLNFLIFECGKKEKEDRKV